MVAENEIRTVLDELKDHGIARIRVMGSLITAKVCMNSSKLWMTTTIYEGKNFIPNSVRQALNNQSPVPNSSINTFIAIDEENFQLVLNYLGLLRGLDLECFKDLLEQFSWDAEEWRYYLDDFDKRDLVHVRRT